MACSIHTRSNSFPSQSHPIVDDVENHLLRLKSSSEATSASAISSNLASLRDLHESINNIIQIPSIQQSLVFNEQGIGRGETTLLDGSLRLVDLCEFSREIVCSTKESVQQLESSIRRNKGHETATADDINAYEASRKKITKMVNKYIKINLKSSNQNDKQDLNAIETMIKETDVIGFTVLKSVLVLVSGEKERSKQRSWSLLSKFAKISSRVIHSVEMCSSNIQELEEGLETLFRSLIKIRVSILNVHNH